MKRTIIAAACGAALLSVACAPPETTGNAASTGPLSGSAAGDAEGAPRTAPNDATGTAVDSRDDDPASSSTQPTSAETADGEGAVSGAAPASQSTTAGRRGDGRARIGDPCPGLTGALRPAVNGENLVCAGDPVPRWTVILDDPSPTDQPGEPGESTAEPTETGGNGNSNGNGHDGGPGEEHDDGPGAAGAPHLTPEPAGPTR